MMSEARGRRTRVPLDSILIWSNGLINCTYIRPRLVYNVCIVYVIASKPGKSAYVLFGCM